MRTYIPRQVRNLEGTIVLLNSEIASLRDNVKQLEDAIVAGWYQEILVPDWLITSHVT